MQPMTPQIPPHFYAADNYVAENGSVGYLMHRISNAMVQELERQFEPSGLTNAQWKPLFKLSIGEVSTVAELARVCTLDAGGMTRMLDRLEAKGLCQRERSSEDRRVVKLALTDAGREAAQTIPETLSRVQNAYLAGFSVEEWQTLKSYLRRMLDNANDIQQAQSTPATTLAAAGEKNAA
jgi:DNA-binding MarR family transcriptional regulator